MKIIVAWLSILLVTSAVAQEKPLCIAELVVHKGFRDTRLGAACEAFNLNGRIEDGKCEAYQLNDDPGVDDDDAAKYGWLKGWVPSFNFFIERGTGKTRIVLADHDAVKNGHSQGYLLLVSPDRELQKAAVMDEEQAESWHWRAVPTNSMRAAFELEKSAWMKAEKRIAELPDKN
jgi:hypothetical protein